jgi:hypothetical protein
MQSVQKQSPGPKESGSWIIQTNQGRWIDPFPKTLDQTVQTRGPRVKRTNRYGLSRPDGSTTFI